MTQKKSNLAVWLNFQLKRWRTLKRLSRVPAQTSH